MSGKFYVMMRNFSKAIYHVHSNLLVNENIINAKITTKIGAGFLHYFGLLNFEFYLPVIEIYN